MTSGIAERDAELNRLIVSGRLIEAFDAFCHPDVAMQENDGPVTVGFETNRRRELDLFERIAAFEEIRLVSAAVTGDVSFSEWVMVMRMRGGGVVRLEQVAVRHWRGNRVASERFYYRPA